jgi:hypothetical protein
MRNALSLTVEPFRAGNPLAIATDVEPLLSKRFEWSWLVLSNSPRAIRNVNALAVR